MGKFQSHRVVLWVVGLVIFVFIFLAGSRETGAQTELHVGPGQAYSTIQAAVDEADYEDTIIVHDNGTTPDYQENVKVPMLEFLTIEANYGDEVTVQAANSNDHVFEITGYEVYLSGFTITGAAGTGKAGVYLTNVDSCEVYNNTVTGNYYGVFLDGAYFNQISDTNCSSNTYAGIYLDSAEENYLDLNTCSTNQYGIYLSASMVNDISYNHCLDNTEDGICLTSASNSNSLTENDCSSNDAHGFSLDQADENEFWMNTSHANGGAGFWLSQSSSNKTYLSTVTSNTGDGIHLQSSSDSNLFQESTITGNHAGVSLVDSDDNSLTYSNIANNTTMGLSLSNAQNNQIYFNDISNPAGNVTATSSTTLWNTPTEILYFYQSNPYSSYLGNYWNDYAGSDADGNGVGDTPYGITGDNDDSYPLIDTIANYPPYTPIYNVNTGEGFTTIQAAIDDSDTLNGHTIKMEPGIYEENIFVNKQLTIESYSGDPNDTIVRCTNPNLTVIRIESSYVTIRGLGICGTSEFGGALTISGSQRKYCTVENNICYGYDLNHYCKFGIYFQYTSDHTIRHNICRDTENGIRLFQADRITINHNVCNGLYAHGISIESSDNNTITGNTCSYDGYDGIVLSASDNNVITANITTHNNNSGVSMASCTQNTVSDNTIHENLENGIYLSNTTASTISYNSAMGNGYGIHLMYDSNNNTIFRNNFSNNHTNADTNTSTSTWRSPTTINYIYDGGSYLNYLGNYWSDYTGSDADGDGVGETAYSISGSASDDDYPLVKPYQFYRAGVDISVELQGDGRPDPQGWQIPLNVKFFSPGADVLNDPPLYDFTLATFKFGSQALGRANGVPDGTYDITASSTHTLTNLKTNVSVTSPGSVDMSTLREGNADNDNNIDMFDYNHLTRVWLTQQGEDNFDGNADLDRNGIVNILDLYLLCANWVTTSPIEIP